MQCRHHHMARLSGFDPDGSRLQIPDLPHQDDIGVLVKKGLKSFGKGHTGSFIYLDLINAGQIDLDRVLGRRDIDSYSIENIDTGIIDLRISN